MHLPRQLLYTLNVAPAPAPDDVQVRSSVESRGWLKGKVWHTYGDREQAQLRHQELKQLCEQGRTKQEARAEMVQQLRSVQQASAALEQLLGRPPTNEELANNLDIPTKRAATLRRWPEGDWPDPNSKKPITPPSRPIKVRSRSSVPAPSAYCLSSPLPLRLAGTWQAPGRD